MTGLVVDAVAVAVVVTLAAFGFRSGLLRAGSALAGLVVGLALAVPVVGYVGRRIESPAWRLAAVLAVLVVIANLGYVAALALGSRLRSRVKRRLAQGVDRAAGGALSAVLGVLLVWMLAVPLASSPIPGVSQAVRGSVLLPGIDAVMPRSARALYDAIDRALQAQGLPDVVGPMQQTNVADVAAPDAAASADPEVVAAGGSVVKVVGEAPKCSRIIDGSGFVYAPGRVVTNAHVVAGTSSLQVEASSGTHDATVVYVDEHLDLAVLDVPGLSETPLPLEPVGREPGEDVVVAGHPRGGPLELTAARVRATGPVTGPTFRGDALTTRDVLMLRGRVVPGNSGGPVVDLDGKVVGVVFGAAADQPDVGYALSVAAVSDDLAAAAAAQQPAATGACYP
ncbi:MarP family serine protease [Cumulibacter manganitolerans]|uniref:MarP family serine protease n=1 Tax=Cumulibacter manganitolerans TaxID=1884992 RepID=UPI0018864CF6|nr:MarP family serine protease [Cumulibacter manganitolerans]